MFIGKIFHFAGHNLWFHKTFLEDAPRKNLQGYRGEIA
jgi:hypothetical protein